MKFDKVEITFIEEDTEDAEKVRLVLYFRREEDREWFQLNVKLDKKHIKNPIATLTPYQKQKYMSKGKNGNP